MNVGIIAMLFLVICLAFIARGLHFIIKQKDFKKAYWQNNWALIALGFATFVMLFK